MKKRTTISLFLALGLFTQACIPGLKRGLLQSISDLLQLNLFNNSGQTNGEFRITANVNNLTGTGLVLRLNGTFDSVSPTTDGAITFTKTLRSGDAYTVTVGVQPTAPIQTCVVAGGTGTIVSGDVSSINVNCGPAEYTVGGTITGLEGSGFVLRNTFDSTDIPITSNGTFAFPNTYVDGTAYAIIVLSAPNNPVQNCSIMNDSGSIAGTDINSITINCISTAYPIRVTSFGIASGTLTLRNNTTESLSISTNGVTLFPTNVAIGATYSLEITAIPTGHSCILSSYFGTVTTTIDVVANCFSVLSVQPANGGILIPTEEIRIQFSSAVQAGSCLASSGNLNTVGGPIQYSVTTTNVAIPNDTLVLSPFPADTWITGHRELDLDCFSDSTPARNLSSSPTLSLLVPSNVRYVSKATGSDTLGGGTTTADPVESIEFAINEMNPCITADCAVLVEAGDYDVSGADSSLFLRNGISIFGSYELGSNFTNWFPEEPTKTTPLVSRLSTIRMSGPVTSCSTTSVVNPCAVVVAPPTILNKTILQGFAITGVSSVPHVAGVFLNQSTNVVLLQNRIIGGVGNAQATGVMVVDSSPAMANNLVSGGGCIGVSCLAHGIHITGNMGISNPILLLNQVSGGTATANGAISRGFFYDGTAGMNVSKIEANVFAGGNLSGTSTQSTGMEISSGGAAVTGTLKGNFFTADVAASTHGLRIQTASTINIGDASSGNITKGGSGTTSSYAIRLTNPHQIQNNLVLLGSANSPASVTETYGIFSGPGAGNFAIHGNRIEGGTATSGGVANAILVGIRAEGGTATSYISRNYIQLGSATGSTSSLVAGIQLSVPGPILVENNWIANGTSSARARGIDIINNTNLIRFFHNTVSSGSGTSGNTYSFFINNFQNNFDMRRNVFLLNQDTALNACLRFDPLTNPYDLNSNLFFNCSNYILQNAGAIVFNELCAGGSIGRLGCTLQLGAAISNSNNISQDPNFVSLFGTPPNYFPTTLSNCNITRMPPGPTNDSLLGIGTRPGPNGLVTIGAVEYEGECVP